MCFHLKKVIIISLLTLITSFAFSATNSEQIKKLKKDLKEAEADTNKVKLLNKIGLEYRLINPDSGLKYLNQGLSLLEKVYYPLGKAKTLKNKAILLYFKNDYPEALDHYLKSLNVFKDLSKKEEIAKIKTNIGSLYLRQGIYDDALSKYLEALKIIEELDNEKLLSKSYNNIGMVYTNQRKPNYKKAMEYYKKSLTIKRKLQDSNGIATVYNNLGNIFYNQGKAYKKGELNNEESLIPTFDHAHEGTLDVNKHFHKARHYYEQSKAHCLEQNKPCKARAYLNIGLILIEKKALDKALNYINKALRINHAVKNKTGEIHCLMGKGEILKKQGSLDSAINKFQGAKMLANEIGNKKALKNAYNELANLYEQKGTYEKAYHNLKQEKALKDTLFNAEKAKQIQNLKIKEKKRKARKRERIEAKKEQRQHRIQYSGIFISLIFLFAFLFLSGNFTLPYKFAEGFIFFNFILLFEFILVILDPYIDHYSGGQPLIKLLANAVLALFIFPAHSFFEDKLKRKVVPGFINYQESQKGI